MWEFARIRHATAVPLAADIAPILTALSDAIAAGQRDATFREDVDPLRLVMAIGGATSFLTLGMRVLAADSSPLGLDALRSELRLMIRRILFRD
jgi:hypothetical protein